MNRFSLPEEKTQNIMLIICVLVVLYTFYSSSKREIRLKTNYIFTVGKTIKYSYAGAYEDYIKYTYIVDSLEYVGYADRDYKMNSPLKKYYKIKYSKVKPEISEMYLTEEVVDSALIVKAGFKYKNE